MLGRPGENMTDLCTKVRLLFRFAEKTDCYDPSAHRQRPNQAPPLRRINLPPALANKTQSTVNPEPSPGSSSIFGKSASDAATGFSEPLTLPPDFHSLAL